MILWGILFMAGAAWLVLSACSRDGRLTGSPINRSIATAAFLLGAIGMLVQGDVVDVLWIGALCIGLMGLGTLIMKSNRTPPVWFIAPIGLCAGSIVLLAISGDASNRGTPEVIFEGKAMRSEQLVILDDARTELELIDQRDFPKALAAARNASDWTRLGDLEKVRGTFPRLREQIRGFAEQLGDGTADPRTSLMVREVAQRIYRIGEFVRTPEMAR